MTKHLRLGYGVLLLALLATGCGDVQPPTADERGSQPPTSADGDAPAGTHQPVAVDDTTFADTVLASSQPVLVDFWAPWCGPCRQLTPVVEQIAAEYAGRVVVTKVNVDEAPKLAAKYEITSIPTLLFLRDGQVVESMQGVQSKRTLARTLDAMLAR